MNPLVQGFANGEFEDELRALFVRLYGETMGETASTINVYGSPHIGPFPLVQRSIAQDGLAVLRQGDEAAIRYLFKAWKFRNPRRGMHFLRTYLQVLYSGDFTVEQMWQAVGQPYPSALKSQIEIEQAGESESAYFLTSRLRVDLNSDELLPIRLVESLKTVVPARFLINIRLVRRFLQDTRLANVAMMQTRLDAYGTDRPPRNLVISSMDTAIVASIKTLLSAAGQLVSQQPFGSSEVAMNGKTVATNVFHAQLES